MTTPPVEPAPTNPPPAPAPNPDPPPRPPVVVNHDNGLQQTLHDLGQTLQALPETLIHSLRESNNVTDPPPAPNVSTAPPPATPETPAQDPNAKRGFANWFFTAGRKS